MKRKGTWESEQEAYLAELDEMMEEAKPERGVLAVKLMRSPFPDQQKEWPWIVSFHGRYREFTSRRDACRMISAYFLKLSLKPET